MLIDAGPATELFMRHNRIINKCAVIENLKMQNKISGLGQGGLAVLKARTR
jgi:hypothetical protein